jgi:N utilization substance protein A
MNGEILRLVDTLHRDKDIEKEIIFQGMEAALLSAVKKKLGESETIRVVIDRVTGATKVIDQEKVILIEDLGRIAAMTGKQVLFQKIREAERDKIYAEYEDKVGKLVTGVVQRAEGQNLIINLGKVEGILPRSEQAPGEKFRVGERIKLLVKDIKKNTNRVKITLSRTSPLLVKALFQLEVPEIAEKVIEIMDIVREPGYRTKIAVTTYDHNVDCVGACVGVRGSRIKNIVDELNGEKIDIIRWSESEEDLITNALRPAQLASLSLDRERKVVRVVVPDDQLALAIGRKGQNVRLATRLTGWDIKIEGVTRAEDLINNLPQAFAGSYRTMLSTFVDDTADLLGWARTPSSGSLSRARKLLPIESCRAILGQLVERVSACSHVTASSRTTMPEQSRHISG